MDDRIQKILDKVEEKGCEKIQKQAELIQKGASISETLGGMAGTAVGAPTGAMVGFDLSANLPKRYRMLATLMSTLGVSAFGNIAGSALGRASSNASKKSKYMNILNAAQVNQQKALTDSIAMRAFNQAGLAKSPY